MRLEHSNGQVRTIHPAVTGATNKAQGNTASLPSDVSQQPLSALGSVALDLAKGGLFILPCKPGGKVPLTNHGVNDATTSEAQIRAWWAAWPDANPAVACGASGLVVLDDDQAGEFERLCADQSQPVPATFKVTTAKGAHHWFRQPTGQRIGNPKAFRQADYLIDVRGDGGYVMAPGAVHETGVVYTPSAPVPDVARLPETPSWLAEMVSATTRRASAPVGEAGQQTALAREMAAVLAAKPGERNNRLNEAAHNLNQLVGPGSVLTEGLVRAVLTEAGQRSGLDAAEVAATVESGLRSGRDNPRAVIGVDNEPSSWLPVDLTAVLDGTRQPITPTLFPRTDGVCLLYPGLTHSFHGESESGKSMLAQIETARLLGLGEHVLYLDFESDEVSVVERLHLFGASSEAIRELFAYVRPESNPSKSDRDRKAWEALLARRFALAVIDGVTDALGLWNAETESNRDVTGWSRELPKLIADRTGAAVLMVDHVTKNADTRGRFAIGGQAKLSALTGAAYTVAIATGKPLSRGLRGEIVIRVAKDRPGFVRNVAGPMAADRTQETARVTVDSTGDLPVVTVDSWRAIPTNEDGSFRPTSVMEKVSRALESAGDSLSDSKLKARIEGVRDDIRRQAVEALAKDGYIEVTPGSIGKAKLHRSLRPYRQNGDPASDRFEGQGTLA